MARTSNSVPIKHLKASVGEHTIDLRGLFQELGAGHLRHSLVGHEHGDWSAPLLEAVDRVQRLCTRARLGDAVLAAIVRPKIALDGVQDRGLVIDGEYYWCGHTSPGRGCPIIYTAPEPPALPGPELHDFRQRQEHGPAL